MKTINIDPLNVTESGNLKGRMLRGGIKFNIKDP